MQKLKFNIFISLSSLFLSVAVCFAFAIMLAFTACKALDDGAIVERSELQIALDSFCDTAISLNPAYIRQTYYPECDTAKDAEYMSFLEKAIVYYINVLRVHGKGDWWGAGSGWADPSIGRDIQGTLQPLMVNEAIYNSAKDHAENWVVTNHTWYYFDKYNVAGSSRGQNMGNLSNIVSANDSRFEYNAYQTLNADRIVNQFILDSGNENAGHRMNMLGDFTSVGVGVCTLEHDYGNIVMNFAK